jgi:glucose/mannose transport system substrate-binding protein
VVRSVGSIFAREGLRARMNPTILKALMHDGRPFGVPTGAHRSNVLFFNKKVLEHAGVSFPSSGYTLAAFLADLDKVKASGGTPLCLGGKDPFTKVELFENTLLSVIGTRGWKDMVNGNLNWPSGRVRTALKRFGAMLDYADPNASRLTWDQATRKLAAGGCAFETMNDSAFGELVADGAHEGEDFGAIPFPGTDDSFLAVVDVAATKAKDAKNALAFLSGIEKPATQLAFSRAKGSIPVVRDVNVSSLPAYQRQSSKAFWTLPVLLSIAHGEALSLQFEEGLYNAVSKYVRTRSPNIRGCSRERGVQRLHAPALIVYQSVPRHARRRGHSGGLLSPHRIVGRFRGGGFHQAGAGPRARAESARGSWWLPVVQNWCNALAQARCSETSPAASSYRSVLVAGRRVVELMWHTPLGVSRLVVSAELPRSDRVG